jgi:sec-independent protein translocase protein TatA
MGLSASHIILVVIAVLVLFGAGRLPKLMEDLAKGMKAFKKGMKDEEAATTTAHLQNDEGKK